MAANKFATMLHRNTNKLTLILIYAIIEWILIILLLLNSLYSYLIIKFADYFGLKRPCLWCSRLDHIFEPQKYNNLHRDLVCENHATEISKLGYCSSHQKLAKLQDMCEDCSSLSQSNGHETSKMAFLRWVRDIGMEQSDGEKRIENDGEVNLNCSCCDVSLKNSKFYSPYLLIKHSWEVLGYTQKEKSITEAGEGNYIDEGDNLDRSKSDYKTDRCTDDNDEKIEEKKSMLSDVDGIFGLKELGNNEEDEIDMAVEAEQEHLNEDESIELIKEPSSDETLIQVCCTEDASLEILPQADRSFPVEISDTTTTEDHSGKEDHGNSDFQETNLGFELNLEKVVEFGVENLCSVGERVEAVLVHQRKEEAKFSLLESMELEENDDYLIFHPTMGDLVMEVVDDVQATAGEIDSNVQAASEEIFQLRSDENEVEIMMGTKMADQEDPSTVSANLIENNDQLHKNLLIEESLDGSVISEFESGEGVSTVEKLQSALRAERKALNALYAELEEERSASAVAATQTMAMINRLQEEKSAMQMEAFQYQRMMEEQSEYDQEALQLLNELMVKREKEKQELEKEVEIYRKKVMDYEAKIITSGTSSASFSNAEDSDGQSVDFNHENGNHNSTPVDEILNLDQSLAHFEEERMSILEQLKVLEEKLFTLDDDHDEEKQLVDGKPIEHFYEENGDHFNDNSDFTGEVNGVENGIGAESEDGGELNGHHENGIGAIEEEVDHVYERLQALEADREFLRHCISSLKKGDKGIDLLQEILLHLRDLRSVDLRVKNIGDGVLH